MFMTGTFATIAINVRTIVVCVIYCYTIFCVISLPGMAIGHCTIIVWEGPMHQSFCHRIWRRSDRSFIRHCFHIWKVNHNLNEYFNFPLAVSHLSDASSRRLKWNNELQVLSATKSILGFLSISRRTSIKLFDYTKHMSTADLYFFHIDLQYRFHWRKIWETSTSIKFVIICWALMQWNFLVLSEIFFVANLVRNLRWCTFHGNDW